ncbi:MAG: Eco57I restriction-modification methylase domain-containing protein [Fibrobacter sp.]|uniref:Eco57I restriction-modification methylase domain-containing protein n=1 Tax=Fibrobacter sp. TaxID=35828 RepID=UPI0025BA8F13|nr:Eco57I restriction-modification methylase domain-containing protein [Fibrobacter sp.]MBS7273009.1 Eco57I restriction-modification methylase domain-containing protein [Fibrobacter sp.]
MKKFFAVIGNPPYQENDGSGASNDAAMPIYNKFFSEVTNNVASNVMLIMPSKWMVGGRGLDKFRQQMIQCRQIKQINDYQESTDCFPSSSLHIDGGVCTILWNDDYDGNPNYIYHDEEGNISESIRCLKNDYSDFIIRNEKVISFLKKVHNKDSFADIVSATKPYGIRKDLFNNPDKYVEAGVSEKYAETRVKIYGVKGIKGGAKRVSAFIKRNYIQKNVENIDKYKIFFTTSYSTNAFNPPESIIASKGEICTETFLEVGPFSSKTVMENCDKYMHTLFFKALLYYGKGTMQVTRDVFRLIPMQNFGKNSDLDWNKTIDDIDKQLCEKYRIEKEMLFIKEKFGGMSNVK